MIHIRNISILEDDVPYLKAWLFVDDPECYDGCLKEDIACCNCDCIHYDCMVCAFCLDRYYTSRQDKMANINEILRAFPVKTSIRGNKLTDARELTLFN